MERYCDSGCTDPTQATTRLVTVLVSRIQKSCTGDNSLVKWKGTFRSDRSKWTMHLQIPVGANQSGPFHWMYQQKFPEFWVDWEVPNELLEMRFEFPFT